MAKAQSPWQHCPWMPQPESHSSCSPLWHRGAQLRVQRVTLLSPLPRQWAKPPWLTAQISPSELHWKTNAWLLDKSSVAGQCIRFCRSCYRKHQGGFYFEISFEWMGKKVLDVLRPPFAALPCAKNRCSVRCFQCVWVAVPQLFGRMQHTVRYHSAEELPEIEVSPIPVRGGAHW